MMTVSIHFSLSISSLLLVGPQFIFFPSSFVVVPIIIGDCNVMFEKDNLARDELIFLERDTAMKPYVVDWAARVTQSRPNVVARFQFLFLLLRGRL